jgi:tRNA C32,U32 (ribose-2'-O)-methylase TrmJ
MSELHHVNKFPEYSGTLNLLDAYDICAYKICERIIVQTNRSNQPKKCIEPEFEFSAIKIIFLGEN